MTYGELFAGVGMASLGFEKAGWEGKWFVEIEDYPHQVYEKNFPEIQGFKDVRKCGKHNLSRVDVIFGGFPCQDLSVAGRQSGLSGERSGLFFEFARIVGELRPRWWIMENVTGLLTGSDGTWFTAVLSEVVALGYDATWHCIPACAVGAPHRRDRVWIVANDRSSQSRGLSDCRRQALSTTRGTGQDVGNAQRRTNRNERRSNVEQDTFHQTGRLEDSNQLGASGEDVAHPNRSGSQEYELCNPRIPERTGQDVADSANGRCDDGEYPERQNGNNKTQIGSSQKDQQSRGVGFNRSGPRRETLNNQHWQPQPRLGRVVDGTSDWLHEPAGIPRLTQVKGNRVNRLKALGNGLIWHIPYMIALGINELELNNAMKKEKL